MIGQMDIISPFSIPAEHLKFVENCDDIKSVGAFLEKQNHRYVRISRGRLSRDSQSLRPLPYQGNDTAQVLSSTLLPSTRGPVGIYPPQRHPPYRSAACPPDFQSSCSICRTYSRTISTTTVQPPKRGSRSCIPRPSALSFLLDPMFHISRAGLGAHKRLSGMHCTQNIRR
jgi:hypothetical protein